MSSLTDDFHFVGGIDLPCPIGHMARVLATVLWGEVLQAECPFLLTAFADLLRSQRFAVLQPHNFWPWVPICGALESH